MSALADPRARDLLTARPDDAGALAGMFRTAATEAQGTATGLAAAEHGGIWTGRAANAFRSSIGRLPSEIVTVRSGFEAVADALAAYEPELARLQSAFRATACQLSDLQARAGAARTASQDAALQIAALDRRAFAILDEFASAREACRRAIAAASRLAPALPPAGRGATTVGGSGPAEGL